ncbi:hypothetical protein BDN70DRAFT_894543 [Pholiota conissans]|uniref:Uncharacterized protein n=1 Tax=Pholiota conissans TaxID=109636 RepID=A0A9P5Z1Z9_9AGAR|nr:hypothetical protein BDN70DRAFT_894543 [Pholiota conissans]
MKPTETFHFDEEEYLNTISNKYFSHTALAKEIYRKRAKKLSSKVRTGVGILAATVTGGASLVGAALSARNMSVENQKLDLLEAEWRRRRHPPLPKNSLKDKIIPITIAVGTSLFAVGIDVALSGASPDQFYQLIPNTAVNDFVISEYYTVVDKGLSSAGNFVSKQVVSYKRGEEYEGGSSRHGNYSHGGGKRGYKKH